ncbi:MAG: hypothetical protein LH618_11545 [Saprospiraceae bacterium]|nr:hypothetical protein [Saprospiraceae bacterium]
MLIYLLGFITNPDQNGDVASLHLLVALYNFAHFLIEVTRYYFPENKPDHFPTFGHPTVPHSAIATYADQHQSSGSDPR